MLCCRCNFRVFFLSEMKEKHWLRDNSLSENWRPQTTHRIHTAPNRALHQKWRVQLSNRTYLKMRFCCCCCVGRHVCNAFNEEKWKKKRSKKNKFQKNTFSRSVIQGTCRAQKINNNTAFDGCGFIRKLSSYQHSWWKKEKKKNKKQIWNNEIVENVHQTLNR